MTSTDSLSKLLSEPTDAQPGSSAKIELLRARAEADLPLFVAGDNAVSAVQGSVGHHAPLRFNPHLVYQQAIEARRAKLAAIRKERRA